MGTPSEVLAGRILERIGFDSVKFVDGHYDFEAVREGKKSVIEVKMGLSLQQMDALGKQYSKGDKTYLLVVSLDGHYCLFELVSTDLAQPPVSKPLYVIVPKQLANSLSEKMNFEPEEAVRKAISNFRVLMTAPLHKVIDIESLKKVEKIE